MAPPEGPSVGTDSFGRGENIGGVVSDSFSYRGTGRSGKHSTTATTATTPLYDYIRNCNQRRALGSDSFIVQASGGNRRVSRVAWDEGSGGDEGGHLHQGPHLILMVMCVCYVCV